MKNLFLFICIFFANYIYSQKYDAYWYFGHNSMLKFNSDIICIEDINCVTNKSSVVISDTQGNLLFYGNGKYLYRSDNSYIENSELDIDGYESDSTYQSVRTQASIVLPSSIDTNIFYIINNTSALGYSDYKGIAYSIFNTNYIDGVSNIDSNNRNIHLLDDYIGNSISAVRHANGIDWWILMHQAKLPDDTTNFFIKYLFKDDIFEGPYYQSIGLLISRGRNNTQMIFNTDGDKLIYYSAENNVEIFNFDRCTGELSEFINFQESFEAYGKAFSPDGTKLYLGTYLGTEIFQYDLSSGISGDDILASREMIYAGLNDGERSIGLMAIGPDDKIYFTTFYMFGPETPATDYNTYLNVIHNPNESGVACNVEDKAVWLCDGFAKIGLPNMPNYRLGALQGSECDTIKTAITEQSKPNLQFTIYPNPASNYLHIETTSQGNNTVIIRDIKGSVCYSSNFNNSIQIPVVHFTEGVYSITIINDDSGGVWSDKFVKM